MVVATLLAAGGLSVATGGAFALVARAVSRLPAPDDLRSGRRAHASWWGALGIYLGLQGAMTVLAAFGALDRDVYSASRAISIPLICTATAGLVYYLVFLFTGRRAGTFIFPLYAGVAALFAYITFFASPSAALVVTPWVVELELESSLMRVVYLLVGLPPISMSIAYLTLLRRLHDPIQKRRILLVSLSILGYVGGGLAAHLGGSAVMKFLALVVLGGFAAIASLAAYYPGRARPLVDASGFLERAVSLV